MTVHYEYTNCYVSPSGYEQMLLAQKDEQIHQLKQQMLLYENMVIERDDEIVTLRRKIDNLLNGYKKRQTSYLTALDVYKRKSKADVEQINQLKEENEKLHQEIESVRAEKGQCQLTTNGLSKENEELVKNLETTSKYLKKEIDMYQGSLREVNEKLKAMVSSLLEDQKTTPNGLQGTSPFSNNDTDFKAAAGEKPASSHEVLLPGLHNVADIEAAYEKSTAGTPLLKSLDVDAPQDRSIDENDAIQEASPPVLLTGVHNVADIEAGSLNSTTVSNTNVSSNELDDGASQTSPADVEVVLLQLSAERSTGVEKDATPSKQRDPATEGTFLLGVYSVADIENAYGDNSIASPFMTTPPSSPPEEVSDAGTMSTRGFLAQFMSSQQSFVSCQSFDNVVTVAHNTSNSFFQTFDMVTCHWRFANSHASVFTAC